MKKIFCLVLCMIFVFSLTSCGKEVEQKPQHSVDIVYYAKLGQINNLPYKLGDDIDDTKNLLSQTTDDHGESNYFDYESGEYTIMTDGGIYCCYETQNAESGLTHIVKSGDAYGFIVGEVSTQIRDVMSNMGYNSTERDANRSEIFFLPSGAKMSVLEYKIEGITLLFVFQEHALSATVISK